MRKSCLNIANSISTMTITTNARAMVRRAENRKADVAGGKVSVYIGGHSKGPRNYPR
jgi:hypothetical protein